MIITVMFRWLKQGVSIFLVVAFFLIYMVPMVGAQTLQSPNYRFDESSIGSGGLIQSSSPNYQGRSSTGDLGIGNAQSSNFQVEAGPITTDNPRLSVAIIDAQPSLGAFSPSTAATATATFSVLNYTSYGYVVQIVGNPPTYDGHEIAPIGTTGPSVPGTDQFGINLVANTTPTSFGANPDQGDFGEGEAAPNYSTSNEFRYGNGETIALAPKSSGETIYTISYLVNVDALTPGGDYTSNQSLIVTGTY